MTYVEYYHDFKLLLISFKIIFKVCSVYPIYMNLNALETGKMLSF